MEYEKLPEFDSPLQLVTDKLVKDRNARLEAKARLFVDFGFAPNELTVVTGSGEDYVATCQGDS